MGAVVSARRTGPCRGSTRRCKYCGYQLGHRPPDAQTHTTASVSDPVTSEVLGVLMITTTFLGLEAESELRSPGWPPASHPDPTTRIGSPRC
jgi:hypothetical protein